MGWGLLAAILFAAALGGDLRVEPARVVLRGPAARVQLRVTGPGGSGPAADLTDAARIESEDPTVARVEPGGGVRAVSDGRTGIRVRAGEATRRVEVVVTGADEPVEFARDVLPTLNRLVCNAGSCHGKASGQNGFRLSLFGSDPMADHRAIALEGRGRRVLAVAPECSPFLLKPTARWPHGGGRRLDPDSSEHEILRRWIAQGSPGPSPGEPRPIRLDVIPAEATLRPGGGLRLRVVEVGPDDEPRDVTHLARFAVNEPEVAGVDEAGRIRAVGSIGEAAITARFGDEIAVARVLVARPDRPVVATPEPRNLVDVHVFARLRDLGIPPSPECGDAEFARRTSLDLCGVLPDPDEVDALASDPDPNRRARWVDRLLARPEHADREAMTWSAVLRNRSTFGRLSRPSTFALHAWIRQALAENRPYDRFVAELLTATGDPAVNPPAAWYRGVDAPERRLEKAEDAAQVFLGVRIGCARCHRHPTERWSQEDYLGFAAHFERVGLKPGPDPVAPRVVVLPRGLPIHPETGQPVPPRPLGASLAADYGPREDPRRGLVEWMTGPGNPYFTRALVNRYWTHLFGRGLVDPEDDLRASNPPTHPELLDALADDFEGNGYDLRRLVRLLATSRAYSASSRPEPENRADRRHFARFYPRRLPAELLLDAIDRVVGVREPFEGVPRSMTAVQLPDDGIPSVFLDVFGRPKRLSACECERSAEPELAQSLHLLNDPGLQARLSDDRGRAAAWASDTRGDAEKVAELYRIALSRRPSPDESAACLEHLARCRASGDARRGYEDLIWAVINTREFQFVH